MNFLVACKNEDDQMKNIGAKVVTILFIHFSEALGQITPKSAMESCRNSKLIQALIVVLLVCKNDEDPFKIESTRVVTSFLLL